MLANYHTHTWRCNHASGSEEDYVQAAIQRGLAILGFSDHTPYIFPDGYYSGFRMKMDQLEGYVSTVLSLREKYESRLRIPLGLEVEYYPDLFPQLMSVLRDQPLDYLILGQHFVGNEMGEHYSGRATGEYSILRRYCEQTMDAMQLGCFSYLAHPDLISFTGDKKVYREYMRRLCREAKSCSIPLELNLHGIVEKRHYPNRIFWEIAAEEGNTVVLGCDAHVPEELSDTSYEKEAMKLVKQLGLELLSIVPLRSL